MTDTSPARRSEAGQRVTAAFARLDARLGGTPFLREKVLSWLRRLSPTDDPADYFRQTRTLPILDLPVWMEEGLAVRSDAGLQDDLVYSTIAGYCHIRLLDDIMDGDPAADVNLLPAAGFFHAEFHGTYTRYFGPEHPFWERFAALWFGAAEATIADAGLTVITLRQFREVTALKVSPAKIPIIATGLHHGRSDALPAWLDLSERLECLAQMTDDLFDWQEDLEHPGRTTYFLSEAESRRAREESRMAWILREGFGWGVQLIQTWYHELHATAATLGSAGLARHLVCEEAALTERAAALAPGYQALGSLARVWPN